MIRKNNSNKKNNDSSGDLLTGAAIGVGAALLGGAAVGIAKWLFDDKKK